MRLPNLMFCVLECARSVHNWLSLISGGKIISVTKWPRPKAGENSSTPTTQSVIIMIHRHHHHFHGQMRGTTTFHPIDGEKLLLRHQVRSSSSPTPSQLIALHFFSIPKICRSVSSTIKALSKNIIISNTHKQLFLNGFVTNIKSFRVISFKELLRGGGT